MQTQTKPIHQITLGTIRASIWKNENNGLVHYDTTFNRRYKEGDQWKSSQYFGRDDLLLLAKLADEVNSWIYAQPREGQPQ